MVANFQEMGKLDLPTVPNNDELPSAYLGDINKLDSFFQRPMNAKNKQWKEHLKTQM